MTFFNYTTGFILSLILTVSAYLLATQHHFSYEVLLITLLALAVVQFLVQAIFFLHLGRTSIDRIIVLACTIVIVLILTSGSIWIMLSLNNRMMPSAQQMEQYMDDQAGM